MEAAIFNALGEPSRLRIVEMLRAAPFSVGEIAESLSIRQPQVSKHLKVLSDQGIVSVEQVSRHRIYRLEAETFDEIADWARSFETLWEVRLDSLGRFLSDSSREDGGDATNTKETK